MAHCKQALKRIRQSEKKRIKAKSVRNEIKSLTKNIAAAVSGRNEAQARELLQTAISKLDKASKIHIYHRNAADRRKSKLARLVNSIGAAVPGGSSQQSTATG